jgi:hypothetical protein
LALKSKGFAEDEDLGNRRALDRPCIKIGRFR